MSMIGRWMPASPVPAGFCQRPGCGLPATAGTHRPCIACVAARCEDDDCHEFCPQLRAVPSSKAHMRIVDAIKATVVRRRDPVYGSLQITDAQIDELARGVASVLLTTFNIGDAP